MKYAKIFLTAAAFSVVSTGFAASSDVTLTVKNMTDKSLFIASAWVATFIKNPNIQINGITGETPSETIPSKGSGKFIISDNGLNGVITGGGINLCVEGFEACGNFPMWAGGNGQDHNIVLWGPVSATSNNQYIVGAYRVDSTDAVLNVYPAVKRK